ncbi:MAG: 50S ribosomal protein L15 [bacterium]
MKLNQLKAPKGAHKKPKRIGCGLGSGHGKTATKGTKGQLARKGGKGIGFEGGQMPLQRRIPKRGFTNPRRKEYTTIDVGTIASCGFEPGSKITSNILLQVGLIKKIKNGVKILGDGEINIPLIFKVDAVSKGAIKKIEAAGGKVEPKEE